MAFEAHELTAEEQARRKEISTKTRRMIIRTLAVEDEDDTSLTLLFDEFFLQISFSDLHPLMVIHFVHGMGRRLTMQDKERINGLNQQCILGGHALNTQLGCYSYRTTLWLDAELSAERFLEILYRNLTEARRGYHALAA